MSLANKVTLVRIIAIPIFIFVLLSGLPYKELISAGVFVLLALSDSLDGYLARKRGEVTSMGKFLDPLADKLLVSAALIFLIGSGVEAWMAFLIIAREFSVMGLRIASSVKKIDMPASVLGKIKTVTQVIAIILVLIKFPYSWWIMLGATIITLVSGLEYFIRNRKVWT